MHIVIWNLKGGQGKTTLALSLAMLHGFVIVTNDYFSPIDEVLSKKKALRLKETDNLPDIPESVKAIYDFGGYPDTRIITATKKAKYVIIPIIYKSALDMQVSINSINEIKKYNNNIIIVANATKKEDLEKVKKVINKFFNYPILEVKESTAFTKSIDKGKSIQELIDSNRLFAFHYKKPLEQINNIFNFIKD